MSIWYEEPTDSEIKQHYGLDPHEWGGSLADKVMSVINKNGPEKEVHVNALLRDGARLFMQSVQAQQTLDAGASTLREMVKSGGEELRAAISDASWGGVFIDDEAMSAIKDVEDECIAPFGGDSLTCAYDQMLKLNDARAHYREAAKEMRTSAPTARFVPHPSKTPTIPSAISQQGSRGSQARTGGPVWVGNVAKDWLASMGRDEKGRPLVSAPSAQSPAPSVPKTSAHRSGSIQAALPGSGITVGRSTPRVPPTARRVNAPEPQAQTPSADDGFEL